MDPQIGIWWDDGTTIAAFSHPPMEHSTIQAGFYDSNLSHVDQWPQVAKLFGLTQHNDYFLIPRGRVVIRCKGRLGVIYHGTDSPCDRLKKIAERFQLQDWRSEVDCHYEIGAAVDALFDDEEE